jgi:hypothetical protein
VVVVGVVGVGQRLGQVLIAPDAAAVFGWAGAASAGAAWVAGGRVWLEEFLYDDVEVPVIAEVVGIADFIAGVGGDLFEGDGRFSAMA